MKPIFKEEIDFLHIKGVNIPEGCWKDGSKIYLNPYSKTPLLKISVVDNNIVIKDDNRKNIEDTTMSIDDILERERESIKKRKRGHRFS